MKKKTYITTALLIVAIIAAIYLGTKKLEMTASINATGLQKAAPGENYTATITITNTGNRPIKETWTELMTTGNAEIERNLVATEHNKTLAKLIEPIKTSGRIRPQQTSTYVLNLSLRPETNNHAQNGTIHIKAYVTPIYDKITYYYIPLIAIIASASGAIFLSLKR